MCSAANEATYLAQMTGLKAVEAEKAIAKEKEAWNVVLIGCELERAHISTQESESEGQVADAGIQPGNDSNTGEVEGELQKQELILKKTLGREKQKVLDRS